jgi:hypothetical protein
LSLADWSLAYAVILVSIVGLAFAVVVLANRRAAARLEA